MYESRVQFIIYRSRIQGQKTYLNYRNFFLQKGKKKKAVVRALKLSQTQMGGLACQLSGKLQKAFPPLPDGRFRAGEILPSPTQRYHRPPVVAVPSWCSLGTNTVFKTISKLKQIQFTGLIIQVTCYSKAMLLRVKWSQRELYQNTFRGKTEASADSFLETYQCILEKLRLVYELIHKKL